MASRWTLWIQTLRLLFICAAISLVFTAWRFCSAPFLSTVSPPTVPQPFTTTVGIASSTVPSAPGRIVNDALKEQYVLDPRFRNPPRFFPNVTETHPVKVFYFPLFPKMVNNDVPKHFVLDGIERSPYLKLVENPADAIVWIASTTSVWNRPGAWCVRLEDLMLQAQQQRHAKSTTPTAWPVKVHILNWADTYQTFTCQRAFNASKKSVYYHKRSLVWNRKWENASMETGYVHFHKNWTLFSAAPVHHIPFCVRSDLVNVLQAVAATEFNYSSGRLNSNASYEWNMNAWQHRRPIDVSHFWPATGPGVDRGHVPLSQLRNAVSLTLETLSPNISTFIELAGAAQQTGRSHVQYEYARKLLESKIVVVAQKDEWEDHYRLMEALVSGAMVLSDVMLTLPQGLEDTRSLVFYYNQSHLQQLVHFYLNHDTERLQIAQEGRRVALTKHRSWHRIEEILFGSILSDVDYDGKQEALTNF